MTTAGERARAARRQDSFLSPLEASRAEGVERQAGSRTGGQAGTRQGMGTSRTSCAGCDAVFVGVATVVDDGGECQRKAGKPFVSIDLVTAGE